MTFNNIILTMTVNDINGAEELSDPSELQMDKRNIASVAREFYGSYKPGSRYDSKSPPLSSNMYKNINIHFYKNILMSHI